MAAALHGRPSLAGRLCRLRVPPRTPPVVVRRVAVLALVDDDADWLPSSTKARTAGERDGRGEAAGGPDARRGRAEAGDEARTQGRTDARNGSGSDWVAGPAYAGWLGARADAAPRRRDDAPQGDEAPPTPTPPPPFDEADALPQDFAFANADDPPAADAAGAPDVSPLLREELEALLPVTGTGASYGYYWGGMDTILRRLSISLAGLLITTNVNTLLAATATLYFVWAPAALAARRNAPLRRFQHAALWHAQVLAVTREDPPPQRRGATPPATTSVLLGDGSGARMEVRVPSAGHRTVRGLAVGAPAELVVVSDDASMHRFKAVRDIFLPRTQEFVCDYPFLERAVMRALSRDVAYERNSRMGNV